MCGCGVRGQSVRQNKSMKTVQLRPGDVVEADAKFALEGHRLYNFVDPEKGSMVFW